MITFILMAQLAHPCTLSCKSINTDTHRVRQQAKRPSWGPRYV